MKLTFKFFDKPNWSLVATLNTIVILLILKLGIKKSTRPFTRSFFYGFNLK